MDCLTGVCEFKHRILRKTEDFGDVKTFWTPRPRHTSSQKSRPSLSPQGMMSLTNDAILKHSFHSQKWQNQYFRNFKFWFCHRAKRLHSHLQTSKYYLQLNSLHTKLWFHITYPVSVKLYIIQLQQNAKLMKFIWWLDRSHCCPHITFPRCTTSIFNCFQSWNSILQKSTIANIDLKFVSNSMLLHIRSTHSVTISWNYSQKLLPIILKIYLSHLLCLQI